MSPTSTSFLGQDAGQNGEAASLWAFNPLIIISIKSPNSRANFGSILQGDASPLGPSRTSILQWIFGRLPKKNGGPFLGAPAVQHPRRSKGSPNQRLPQVLRKPQPKRMPGPQGLDRTAVSDGTASWTTGRLEASQGARLKSKSNLPASEHDFKWSLRPCWLLTVHSFHWFESNLLSLFILFFS